MASGRVNLGLAAAWTTVQILSHPGLQNENMFQINRKKEEKKKKRKIIDEIINYVVAVFKLIY